MSAIVLCSNFVTYYKKCFVKKYFHDPPTKQLTSDVNSRHDAGDVVACTRKSLSCLIQENH